MLNDAEYAALLRAHLALFIERAFMHLNRDAPYQPNWHIDLIAAKLEAVQAGTLRRLIINVPPRSLKSLAVSVAFPAWLLGHNSAKEIICASYGQDLSDKFAGDCRNVMTSDWYGRLFGPRLAAGRASLADLRTLRGGGRYATSVAGPLTGRGGDLILIDDPLKPDQALSEVERHNVNHWFDHTVMSRLNDKEQGAIVIIMQRLHLDDLVGHVVEQGGWEVVSLPAIAEQEETFVYASPLGQKHVMRQVGDLLHPARESRETLQVLRATLGEYHFAGQYQQSPVPLGGGLVKHDWIRYYEPYDLPAEFDQIMQSWDTANKETELSDFSVCTTWGIHGDVRYLLHVLRRRMNFPDLKRAVGDLVREHRPAVVLIEDKASGTQLIQELRNNGISSIKEVKSEGSKVMRMHAQTSAFEGGFVRLPRQAPWLDTYVTELTTFPKGRHDDQVDSTAQALAWITLNGVEPALITFYRQQVEDARESGYIA